MRCIAGCDVHRVAGLRYEQTMPGPSRALFESLIQQAFSVRPLTGEGETELVLTAVEPLMGAQHAESFRLVFEGPRATSLAQGLFHFEHAQLAREPLFIVPVGRSASFITYEAVFNRG